MTLQPLRHLAICAVLLAFPAGNALAGEKTVMHCFAWTPIKEATPADWDAFYKASDALPKQIKGIVRVWYGKLLSPLSQGKLGNISREDFQKYASGQQVTVPVAGVLREYGMCMEMKNADVLKAYGTHPYHKVWNDAYEKIRVDGTTTFNISGQ